MKNKRYVAFLCKLLLSIGIVVLFSCSKSPFASSTGAGENIVDDFDPAITDINHNVKTFFGGAEIDSTFSMRDLGDSVFSGLQWNTPLMLTGTFNGLSAGEFNVVETSFSYVEFRPDTLRANTDIRKMLDTAFSIDSVVFAVNRVRLTVDSSAAGSAGAAGIDMFPCGVLKDSTAFALKTDSIDFSGKLGTFFVSLDSAAADSLYSVKLDSAAYVPRIRNAVKDAGQDTSRFAFCLKPSPNSQGVVRFDNSLYQPRILVYYRPTAHDSTSTATMYRFHVGSLVTETDSTAECPFPFSTFETGRRAVIKLDMTSLGTFLDTAAEDGKRFMIIQRADLKLNLAGLISDLRNDSVQILYNFSDTLCHTAKDFTMVSSFKFKNDGTKNTVYTLPSTTWLQKFVAQKRSNTVYLYITVPITSVLSPSFIQADWTQPSARLELNAIVTNPR